MRGCLTQFVRRRLPVIPVLLPDALGQPNLPLFLEGFTWVDLRTDGLSDANLDRLEWGITGRKPSRPLPRPLSEPVSEPTRQKPETPGYLRRWWLGLVVVIPVVLLLVKAVPYLFITPQPLLNSLSTTPPAATQQSSTSPATDLSLAASKEFQDKLPDGTPGPEMVKIRGGRFLMGSPADEKGRGEDERQHEVQVADFAMGKYEVTVGQFRKFVESTGYQTEAEKGGGCSYWAGSEWKQDAGKNWRNLGFSQTDDHPVVCVSWNDAMAYVDWLSKQTSQTYRLPTEAEWEYAARAGTQTAYYWGNDPDQGCIYANGADQTFKEQFPDWKWPIMNCRDGYVYTAPVGHFRPNAFGLYGMLGNVWEWTCSGYDKDYGGAEQHCVSDKGASGPCVLRGGSWYDAPGGAARGCAPLLDPARLGHQLGFSPGQDLTLCPLSFFPFPGVQRAKPPGRVFLGNQVNKHDLISVRDFLLQFHIVNAWQKTYFQLPTVHAHLAQRNRRSGGQLPVFEKFQGQRAHGR